MKRTSPLLVLSIFATLLFFIFGSVRSTASGPQVAAGGHALPASLPEMKSVVAKQGPAPEIDKSTWQQIQALLEEKEARTAVQQKIDSQLLYAIKMRRGESIAKGVQRLSVDVGADDDGLVTVDITAIIDDQLLDGLRGMSVAVSNVFRQYNTLRAFASLDQLETIAAFPQVRFIQPKQEALFSQAPPETQYPSYPPRPTEGFSDHSKRAARVQGLIQQAIANPLFPAAALKIGSVTSQGDTTHAAFSARGTFNVDGTGIKIGVLSDGVDSLGVSQGTGDLGTVTVLPGQAGFGDEGTAMLEIIHDLAPGAQLYFATAVNGLTSFAQNIRDLRTAGCDIILDDVGYFVESPFQDGQTASIISTTNGGLATQAVNDVEASGALYFSSAANSGNKNDGTSGTWEGDFVDGGPLSQVPGGSVHDFDPTATVVQYDTITADGGPLNMHWSDPLGGSSNDYDLFVLDSLGSVVASSTNIQSGTQDPYEQTFGFLTLRVVILKKTGAANRFLHLATNRGELSFSTDGETHGHNAASGAYGVAAVCAVCVFPAVFSSSDQVETFSSDGPRRILYNGNGTPITPGNVSSTGGTVLQKPDITAADGTSVSGAGGFPTLFYGTSASAPHAAAIAALLKSANPALTQGQIKTALTSSAIDIEAPGTDRDSGAGIVMAYAALQSLGPPVVGRAFLDRSTVSKTETCCNGDGFIEPGETGTLNVTLRNLGVQDATSATATLTTSTSGVTIVNGASAYPNLAASGGSGSNTTPFSFSLSASLPHKPRADFILTINYLGGHQASQSWTFSVQFGVELIENGSFEESDFGGWNVSTVSTGGEGTPFQPWSVSQAGAGGYAAYSILSTAPQDGAYDAWNGFDGSGPLEFRMYRDVTIPAGATLNLTWKDRAQWNFCCGATLPRTYDVQLRNPATNAVLTTLYTFSTGTTPGYHNSGWLTHGNDLSAYAGQTVRIFFLQTIPEYFTGPAQIEFDAISLSNGPLPTPTPTPTPPVTNTVKFNATTFNVTEALDVTTKIDLQITRAGDTSGAASVNYATADGSASERSDYLAAIGTLRFAAGETSKSITVFIVDDRLGEAAEAFNVALSNPIGCAISSPTGIVVTINSNESVNGLNPVKDASFNSDFFVRQQYLDFFTREADAPGLAFWKNQIDECTTQSCREIRRINVSAAFFVSIEFQETGYLVYKANQAAFNSGELLKLRDFLLDTQEIGRGVVIGQPGAEALLEANKQRFFDDFVQRSAFLATTAYPTTMTAAQFVDKLNANTFDPRVAGSPGALSPAQRDALVAQLAPNPSSPTLRAQVLRSISQNSLFHTRQFNKAFVLMQYFGYLRRSPNDSPEPGLDFTGYNFWLDKLNQFNGNFVNAEMVKAFIISSEYQRRFGP